MFMRNSPTSRNFRDAFTLIEMLAVIAMIGILAGLLLPALGKAKVSAQRKMCQTEENGLVGAIETYYSTYSRLPASANAVNFVAGTTDFTYGTCMPWGASQIVDPKSISGAGKYGIYTIVSNLTKGQIQYQNNNSEVIAILRDDKVYPEYNSTNGQGHIYNPQQTAFYQGKAALNTNSPGIGSDGILRDPWGMPYIVTLDLSGDNRVFDYFLNGMYQNSVDGTTPNTNATLLIPGHAVVWSFGPSKHIDLGKNSLNSVNKYMVTSY